MQICLWTVTWTYGMTEFVSWCSISSCNETNLMQGSSSVDSVTLLIHVARYQEVTTYICNKWHVLCGLVDCHLARPADSQLKRTTRAIWCIYTLLRNCIMTNVMHKFLIYLSNIYFCHICFGLSFSPYSEADVQFRQWFKSLGYGVSAWASLGADTISRRLEPLPKWYTCLWRWDKRKPETCKAEVNS
jgi:hypothetical protein